VCVCDHAVNTREIYRNRQYPTRVLKIRENLFLETKVKINSKSRRNKHIISLEKRRREEELSFFLFSETFPRAPPPPASRI
jgi:hypothetical protein